MLKIILPLGLTLCLATLAIPLAKVATSQVPEIVLSAVAPPASVPPSQMVIEAASVTPGQIEELAKPPEEDPWFQPLRSRVEELSDAYMDKPHTHRGLPAGEPQIGREIRLNHFTTSVLAAVRARAGELAQFGPDAAWEYAVTLACIAHRETRIASNPSKLGDQDGGRAHGYWQVWSWHGADPYSADTALDMLLTAPTSSWALPAKHPWTGYPECSAWLKVHPAP